MVAAHVAEHHREIHDEERYLAEVEVAAAGTPWKEERGVLPELLRNKPSDVMRSLIEVRIYEKRILGRV